VFIASDPEFIDSMTPMINYRQKRHWQKFIAGVNTSEETVATISACLLFKVKQSEKLLYECKKQPNSI
jgi:hypothetical protein